MNLKNNHDRTFTMADFPDGISDGLTIENCHRCRFENLFACGGHINILMLECTACVLANPICCNPTPAVFDPIDPESHNIQLDKCRSCHVISPAIRSATHRGDGISFYKSEACSLTNLNTDDTFAEKAWPIVIDAGCRKIHVNLDDSRQLPKGLCIADGSGHKIDAVKTHTISITGEYYRRAVRDVTLINCTWNELYAPPRWCKGLKKINCGKGAK